MALNPKHLFESAQMHQSSFLFTRLNSVRIGICIHASDEKKMNKKINTTTKNHPYIIFRSVFFAIELLIFLFAEHIKFRQ